MYKVLRMFTDLQDEGYKYHAGDEFPRAGLTVSAERLNELASSNNKRGVALIERWGNDETEPAEDFMNPPVEDAAKEKPKRKRKQKNVE